MGPGRGRCRSRPWNRVKPLTVESIRTEQAQLEVAERALVHLVSETFWDGARIAPTADQLNAHSIGSAIVDLPGTWDTVADFNALTRTVNATFPMPA